MPDDFPVHFRNLLAQVRHCLHIGAHAGGGDRRAAELDHPAHLAPVIQLVGIGGVRVAGERDQAGAGRGNAFIQALPRRRIAVPGVEIPGQAECGETEKGLHFGNILRRDLRRCQGLGEIRQPDPGHDDLIGQHLPGRAGGDRAGQFAVEPGFLFGAKHGARGIGCHLHEFAGLGPGLDRRGRIAKRRRPAEAFRAAGQARFQGVQRCHIAEAEAAPDRCGHGPGGGLTNRHPLEIGLNRSHLPVAPLAFAVFRIVILCAGPVSVIGAFMIVPGANPGRGGMGGLQVGIGLVLGMAPAIVRQRDNFRGGFVQAPDGGADLAAIPVDAVFIDIIAQMDDRIEIGL